MSPHRNFHPHPTNQPTTPKKTAPSPRLLSTPEEFGSFQRAHPVAFLLALPAPEKKGKVGHRYDWSRNEIYPSIVPPSPDTVRVKP